LGKLGNKSRTEVLKIGFMIVIRLKGGLGNQMFQYAIGKQLSNIHKTKLILDLSYLLDRTPKENFTFRNFELSKFNIDAEYKSNSEFEYLYNNNLISKVHRKISRINFISENDMRFNPNVWVAGKNIYLDGYWQCEKYFESIRSILLNDFKLRPVLLSQIDYDISLLDIKKQITSTNSIAVHFRRGDYVTDSVINQQHGTCSILYYRDAIKYISNIVKNPHFYLFSDDSEWLSNQNIIEDYPTNLVVTTNMHLDMYLMSLCKHNIIANSSFSWWSAWLNNNENKIIIAPKRWFRDDKRNAETKNLIPEAWIKI
jgi:hypothetical protein